MTIGTTTFANALGEFFAPLLLAVRSTGFFEAYVFLPLTAILAIMIFVRIYKKMAINGTFELSIRQRYRRVILPLYFMMCFFFTGGLAIAFKTMIIEEMDYTEPHWYIPYVSHLHFFIASVSLAYMYLMHSNNSSLLSKVLGVYVQIGFVGAYVIGAYRVIYEPWVLSDPASGLSGFYLSAIFGILHFDVILRLLKPYDRMILANAQQDAGGANA